MLIVIRCLDKLVRVGLIRFQAQAMLLGVLTGSGMFKVKFEVFGRRKMSLLDGQHGIPTAESR